MKRFKFLKIVFVLCALVFSLSNFAQDRPADGQFKTPQEAANHGKADLLEVLKTGRDLNIGVTAEQLANSTPGKAISKKALNFDKLLNLDNAQSLKEVEGDALNTVVPMLVNGKVVTVIDVKESNGNWVVAGLGGLSTSNDLSVVLAATNNAEIVIYEVPNLQSTIYMVVNNGQEMYYTTLKENQSLRTPISRAELFPMLQEQARAFEAEWGAKVKEGNLVR